VLRGWALGHVWRQKNLGTQIELRTPSNVLAVVRKCFISGGRKCIFIVRYIHTFIGHRPQKISQAWRPPRTLPPAAFDHIASPIRPIATKFEHTIDYEVEDITLRFRVHRHWIRHRTKLHTEGVRNSKAQLSMGPPGWWRWNIFWCKRIKHPAVHTDVLNNNWDNHVYSIYHLIWK
jgi:hypothetical protein